MTGPRPSALRVIVTRPLQDAARWVEGLAGEGFAAEALPLIDIVATVPPADPARMHGYDALMFVSSNAVTHFFRGSVPSIDAGSPLRFLAPGPGTAAALLAAGVPADRIDAPPGDALQFDSESLWQQVGPCGWQGRKVLVVRGASAVGMDGNGEGSGREWLAGKWRDAGATVDFFGVYARHAPPWGAGQLAMARDAAADGSVWLFSSSEAALNLMQAPDLAGASWRGARAVATHPRIAQTLRDAGWGVVVASRPGLIDIVAALRSIESESHE